MLLDITFFVSYIKMRVTEIELGFLASDFAL
jgi:hypothetical protein